MNQSQFENLIRITSLGQAGFIISQRECTFIIDPYLSNYVVDSGVGSAELFSREFEPPIQPKNLSEAQVVFVTHDHADHCDPQTLRPICSTNSGVVLIGPRPVFQHLRKEGFQEENLIVPEPYKLYRMNGIEFYAIPAAHYGFDQDKNSGEFAYFGYVIKVGKKWLYHSGDTILYDGIVEGILTHTPVIQIACLPVNGRDAKRESLGMIGNLDGSEALELAQKLHCEILIPMHNDLFKVNHISNGLLAELIDQKAPRQKIHWLQPGENYYMD
jgi:L-ascorbate 6-phosphate lactonase